MISNKKYVEKLIWPLFDSEVRPQLMSTECSCRNLLLTIIISCVDNTYRMTPESNMRQASFLSQGWYCRLFSEINSHLPNNFTLVHITGDINQSSSRVAVSHTCSATVIRLLESTSRPSSFRRTRRHTPTAYEFRSCTAAQSTIVYYQPHANLCDKLTLNKTMIYNNMHSDFKFTRLVLIIVYEMDNDYNEIMNISSQVFHQ